MFLAQYYFSVPKNVRLNSTHYKIFKINNRRELQNIAINQSADFLKMYRNSRKEFYCFFNINTT